MGRYKMSTIDIPNVFARLFMPVDLIENATAVLSLSASYLVSRLSVKFVQQPAMHGGSKVKEA